MQNETHMTKEEAAAALDGNQYGGEGSPELFARMKAARLVCLFGYSDDVIELRGFEDDERGAGETLHFTEAGWLQNSCEDERCPYFAAAAERASTVEVRDGGDEHGMFKFVTTIPHVVFKIMEDDDLYSSGIVFSLDEVQ